MKIVRGLAVVGLAVAVLLAFGPALSQDPSAARVAALKEWLVQSKTQMKGYQWIETTVVSHDGEEKSRTTKSCYYDVTGTLQKVEMSSTPPPKKKPGLRGAIQKDEQAKVTDYMKKAVALVKSYMPPNPEKIQASKEAGNMSMDLLAGGSGVKLHFKNYELPGDDLWASLDTKDNHLLAMGVSSYIDEPKDVVSLDATIAALPDGTGYVEKMTLVAAAKKIQVVVTNSGYRKAS